MNWTKNVINIWCEDLNNETGDLTRYTCNAKVTGYTDSNYGADADGHRGYPMDFVDEIELEEITMIRYNEDGEIVEEKTLEESELPDNILEELREEAIQAEGDYDGDYDE